MHTRVTRSAARTVCGVHELFLFPSRVLHLVKKKGFVGPCFVPRRHSDFAFCFLAKMSSKVQGYVLPVAVAGLPASVRDALLSRSHVHMVLTLLVNMLMTLFLHMLLFSSYVTCMRYGGDVCPLIGATATSTNEAFFSRNGRDCHPTRIVHKKTADVRSPTVFFRVVATEKL